MLTRTALTSQPPGQCAHQIILQPSSRQSLKKCLADSVAVRRVLSALNALPIYRIYRGGTLGRSRL